MRALAPQLLDHFPYSQYADEGTIQRGRAYYKDDRVWDITLYKNNSRAVCQVDGNSGEYTVKIEADQKSSQPYFDCDCPYAENHFCKHMVAAAFELSAYLKDEENDDFGEENDVKTLFS